MKIFIFILTVLLTLTLTLQESLAQAATQSAKEDYRGISNLEAGVTNPDIFASPNEQKRAEQLLIKTADRHDNTSAAKLIKQQQTTNRVEEAIGGGSSQ